MSSMARPDNRAAWLPEGKTCADCRHLDRCVAMFAGFPEATACDWQPSRFSPKPVAIEAGEP